jgi:peptidoglycan biosynthesis protein MviN/MurJ (putative lipid II flippase)
MVLVVADTRLQESITGSARATVTSMASLGSEVSALALYTAWAIAGLPPVVVLIAVVAAALPRWLRGRTRRTAVHTR